MSGYTDHDAQGINSGHNRDHDGSGAAFAVTFFPNEQAFSKTEELLRFEGLAAKVRSGRAASKDKALWLKLARFGDLRTKKECLRSNANLLSITGVEADYDRGEIGFDDAVSIARDAGLQALLYTSASHRPDRPRWRVLCPTSGEMEPGWRGGLMGRLHGIYAARTGGDVFATESWSLSQAYYFGRIDGSPHYRVEATSGLRIDRLDGLTRDRPGWAGLSGGVGADPRADEELVRLIVTGQGYHFELAALAARYIGRSVDPASVRTLLEGLMDAHPDEARDERWRTRRGGIGDIVASAARKYIPEADRRRSIAALTHRLFRAGRSGAEIKAALIEAARECGMDEALALRIGGNVCTQYREGRRHG